MWKESPLAFRSAMQSILSKFKEDIMKWGDQTDTADNLLTEQMFVGFLDGKMSPLLAKVVFGMIYSAKDDAKKEADKKAHATKKVSRVEVVRFAQGYKAKAHVRRVTEKDALWVLQHLQKTNFAQIDKNEHYKITKEDFAEYFKPMGLSQARVQQVFEEIDEKKQGSITVVAYNKWRSRQKPQTLRKTLNK